MRRMTRAKAVLQVEAKRTHCSSEGISRSLCQNPSLAQRAVN